MVAPVPLSALLTTPRDPGLAVALRGDETLRWGDFTAAVAAASARLAARPESRWALFHADSYRFAIGLFALLHAGKQVWLPGNNQPGTEAELAAAGVALLGEFAATALDLDAAAGGPAGALAPLDAGAPSLVLMTSGSTGQPKRVIKNLAQLEAEIRCQEQCWGELLADTAVFATVSHQHIYGLLFRLLWPLCCGRPFAADTFLYPEPLFAAMAALGAPTALIASPAFLKRLPTDFEPAARPALVCCSGGPLPAEAAAFWAQALGESPLEILGSTETGGVATRRQSSDALGWTPLPGVEVRLDADGVLAVRSPFIGADDLVDGWYRLGDRARLRSDGGFELLGRADQIVKIEEKRVALNEMAALLQSHPLVAEARLVPLPGERLQLGAVVELTKAGAVELQAGGKRALNEILRAHLLRHYERVVLPRKWRYPTRLPADSQGKTTLEALRALFEPPPALPGELLRREPGELELAIDLHPDNPAFAGHFPELPVLPGVVQLDWAIRHAEPWYAGHGFAGIDQLKFREVIPPGRRLQLRLADRGDGVVEFRYALAGAGAEEQTLSSGRIRFEAGR